MLPTMQGLVEDVIYVSQGGIPISGGDAAYQWNCAWHLIIPHGLINQFEPQLTRSEDYLQSY